MVIAVFRARVRPENQKEYYALAEKMGEIARSMPGFLSWKVYVAEDGERVSIHEWESVEQLHAWRTHPKHVETQELGRQKYYEDYTLYVCESPRESRFG
jgi:heme-degrading monooxygenase HmoA